MSAARRTQRELALGWREALVTRDARAFAGLFAPDGAMVDVEHRTADLEDVRPILGRDAIEALALRWLDDTPAFEFDVLDVLANASTAAYRWRYQVAADGDRVEFAGITWLNCGDGHIRDALVCFDSYRLLRRAGRVMPIAATGP